jgi:NADH-quinone oxidoreductase subunit G
MGMLGRGKQSEIGLYIDNFLNTELGSNIVELCPVGALTSKVYSFKYRSWDSHYYESIDVTDSLCSPIRIFIQSNKINRILPQYDDLLNWSFLTEKARFIYDSLSIQRLDTPHIKNFLLNKVLNHNIGFSQQKFISISWKNLKKVVLNFYLNLFSNNFINYWTNKNLIHFKPIIGDLIDLELINYLKLLNINNTSASFFNGIDNLLLNSFKETLINYDNRLNYIFKSLQFNKYNLCLLINLNLRLENPLLNAKIRQEYIWNNLLIYSFANKFNLTYKYLQISNSLKNFVEFIEGRKWFTNLFINDKYHPLVLYSSNLLQRSDNFSFNASFSFLKRLKIK